jgi:glycosyltransferase involved in cell wall biosynthesis
MSIELSIVMPCLNEAETLAACIRSTHEGAKLAGVERYEIIVADNGSMDGSQEIARAEGATVVDVPIRGYGAALRSGIEAAQGKYVIMGDSDESYDFSNIEPFVNHLREGIQLVMGTRLRGEILPGAMPFLHRYLGNPILTRLANLLFKTRLSDYHCGMRGFDREAILRLGLTTEGMEFASEMVIRARHAGLSEAEVPITYHPDGRSRPPHLRTWQDGWRHLRFMLLYSPRWLFLYPGLLLSIFGLIISSILLVGPIQIGEVVFGVHTLLFTSTLFVVGVQLVFIAIFARAYASRSGLLPPSPMLERGLDRFSLGLGLGTGLMLCLAGIALYGVGLVIWGGRDFGPLPNFKHTLRIVIVGTTLLILGVQVFFGSFVLSLISLR